MFDFSKVRIVEDFPKEGIKFYDITTLLNDAEEYRKAIDEMLAISRAENPDVVAALETRGFFFAPVIAYELGVPFVPIRKKGKLPGATFSESYELEYGTAELEIHQGCMPQQKRVLVIDDVLATGGSMRAAINLVQHFSPAYVSALFLMELKALEGRKKLSEYTVNSLIQL
jgi:adenine phosphoribosyltransferase